MSITENRKKSIVFSQPYAIGSNQLVMRRDLNLPPTEIMAKLRLTEIDGTKQATLDQLSKVLTGRKLGVLRSSRK